MHDFASFGQLVHQAYAHLYDRPFLQHNPLTRLLSGTSPNAAEQMSRTLIDAIEWLRPLSPTPTSTAEWRRYRHLKLRYLEGASTERIARELLVSGRQARRDHVEALDEVARQLWQRLIQPDQPDVPAMVDPTAAISLVSANPGRPSTRSSDRLDAELSILASKAASAPTDLEEVIRSVVETVARLADAHHTKISMMPRQPQAPVETSRTILRQLLLNLLSDAIVQHPDAVIRVSTVPGNTTTEIVLEICDPARQGSEPDAPVTPASPFEDRLESLTREVSSLEVTERLARSQDLVLRAEVGPKGVTLRIAVPASQTRTLLVVDDNPDVALLFERYLADTPYRLVQARSAERALQLAREYRPDVVFLDVLMPAPDGWEILQTLRKEPLTAELPVVVCSVLPDRALAQSLGVDGFLSKPVTRAALLEVLARHRRGTANDVRPDPHESNEPDRPRAVRPPG